MGPPIAADEPLRLFHDEIILYGFDPTDAPCDFTRFIDGLLRINEAAQLTASFPNSSPFSRRV